MYYNDVHFNSVNTRMHINLKTKSCNENSMKTRFKVDTGTDGKDLAKMVDSHTKLYAYNNTEIKQLGVCELLVEYKANMKICEFYIVDFPTAILGIHDSESLKLITVHFNSIDAETSQTELVPRSAPMYYRVLLLMSLVSKSNVNTVCYSLVLGT